jgi:hypothetical protein
MANATHGDELRDDLRTLIATIDHDFAQLPPPGDSPQPADQVHDRLRQSWSEFVKLLGLGPKSETQQCPACGGVGMREASRCGHCWAKLDRLPPIAIAVAAQLIHPVTVATDVARSA